MVCCTQAALENELGANKKNHISARFKKKIKKSDCADG